MKPRREEHDSERKTANVKSSTLTEIHSITSEISAMTKESKAHTEEAKAKRLELERDIALRRFWVPER